jgi:hypothetical protein
MTNQQLKAHFIQVVKPYIHESIVDEIANYFVENKIVLKITKNRITKLGDFRPKASHGLPQITVNGGLNKYSFLITLIHEMAHFEVFSTYGLHNVKPHGEEWKMKYRNLMLPFIKLPLFPEKLHPVLKKHVYNPAASSCSDKDLDIALSEFDKHSGYYTLSEIEYNQFFIYNGKRLFKKVKPHHSRFFCEEYPHKKAYLFNSNAKVLLWDFEKKKVILKKGFE